MEGMEGAAAEGRQDAPRARLHRARRLGVEPPDVSAGLLHVLLVAERPVGLDEMDQRVRSHRAPRVRRDQVLQVQDRRVEGLETHVVQRRLVFLRGEALLQVIDPLLRALGRRGTRIAVEQLLVGGERRLAVGRVQLGPPPEVGVDVAHPKQRLGSQRIVRRVVGHLPELARGLEVAAHGELRLALEHVRLGRARVARRELEQDPVEMLESVAPLAMADGRLRLGPERVDLAARGRLGDTRVTGVGVARGSGVDPPQAAAPSTSSHAASPDHRTPVRAESPVSGDSPSADSRAAAASPIESAVPAEATV